jgi:hypothetical protein
MSQCCYHSIYKFSPFIQPKSVWINAAVSQCEAAIMPIVRLGCEMDAAGSGYSPVANSCEYDCQVRVS